MARKTILVCDKCGKEVDEDKGAVLRVTYADARRTSKQADLCESCAGTMPGRAAAVAAAAAGRSPRSGLSRRLVGARRRPGGNEHQRAGRNRASGPRSS